MKIKDYKCKCGHNDFFFADKGSQKGIYCSYCGKWFKWADKDEQNLVMKQEPCEDWYDIPSGEMTLEQARQAVKDLRKKLAGCLKKEPCEDAISRQEAIDTIESWLSCDDYNKAERHIMRAMQSVLYDLPPVTPQPKTGHWIDVNERLPEKNVEVLVTTEWNCITIGEMISSNDWFIHEGATNADIDDIKAWMPLPAPFEPQEVRDRND